MNLIFPQECLDFDAAERDGCSGPLRYRMTLSTRARGSALCDFHWAQRLEALARTSDVYGSHCPAGVWTHVAPPHVWRRIVDDVVNDASAQI